MHAGELSQIILASNACNRTQYAITPSRRLGCLISSLSADTLINKQKSKKLLREDSWKSLQTVELWNHAYHIPSTLSAIGRVTLGTRRDIVSDLKPWAIKGQDNKSKFSDYFTKGKYEIGCQQWRR